MASVFSYVKLFTEQLECPHNMGTGFPQSELLKKTRQKPQPALLARLGRYTPSSHSISLVTLLALLHMRGLHKGINATSENR